MVWSNLLAIRCIADSRERVVQLARILIEAVELKPDSLWGVTRRPRRAK
jgi:hypothetical protein